MKASTYSREMDFVVREYEFRRTLNPSNRQMLALAVTNLFRSRSSEWYVICLDSPETKGVLRLNCPITEGNEMSSKKLNESHDASGKGPSEGAPQANPPLNEGNPNHQDVKGRMGNFTGTGEPSRQVYSNTGQSKKPSRSASKKKK
jgi:hypothetical protein